MTSYHRGTDKINNMKEAVCLSINNYPGSDNDLQECNNDSLDLKEFFESLGFVVTRYVDSQVTKNLFISELTRLVNKAVAGDTIILSYSGHGTQIFDKSGDEVDYYDEAVYLYDGALTDDVLCNILLQLKDGITCIIILDSCFSGTGTRKKGNKTRFIKLDKRKKKGSRRSQFLRSDNIKNLLFAGCSDSEYSYDANLLNNGAFTYYFIDQYVNGMTYQEHKTAISRKLPSSQYPQTPQLEGPDELKAKVAYGVGEEDIPVHPVQSTNWTDIFLKIIEIIKNLLLAIFGAKKNKE